MIAVKLTHKVQNAHHCGYSLVPSQNRPKELTMTLFWSDFCSSTTGMDQGFTCLVPDNRGPTPRSLAHFLRYTTMPFLMAAESHRQPVQNVILLDHLSFRSTGWTQTPLLAASSRRSPCLTLEKYGICSNTGKVVYPILTPHSWFLSHGWSPRRRHH